MLVDQSKSNTVVKIKEETQKNRVCIKQHFWTNESNKTQPELSAALIEVWNKIEFIKEIF